VAELRVVDAGTVGALRSQALWHGLAEAATAGARPTLSLCRSAEPYVGLGYHHPLAELDVDACRRLALPIIRRRIGGGAVYVDADQLLFQLTLPAASAPATVDRLYRRCLTPAVEAFAALGVEARLRGVNDISVGDRKVSGTGAGLIGGGVTVVGNIIFRFPHRRMAEVLDLGDNGLRAECLQLMRRHVSSLADEGAGEVTVERAKQALVEAYAAAYGRPVHDELNATEEAAVAGWESRFLEPTWLRGPRRPLPGYRQLKIAEGVWLVAAGDGELSVRAAIVDGRIQRMAIGGPAGNGSLGWMAGTLRGAAARPAELSRRLRRHGEGGERLARLLAPCLPAI
jgi:lipoate-protein ligase A